MGLIEKDVMEKKAIQRLFKQHYAKMYRVARTILYDEQESEDVVSDIFESLLRRQIVLTADTEECYLLTSVRNMCLKRLRHSSASLEGNGYIEPIDDSEMEDERLTDIDEFVARHLTESVSASPKDAVMRRLLTPRASAALPYGNIFRTP